MELYLSWMGVDEIQYIQTIIIMQYLPDGEQYVENIFKPVAKGDLGNHQGGEGKEPHFAPPENYVPPHLPSVNVM